MLKINQNQKDDRLHPGLVFVLARMFFFFFFYTVAKRERLSLYQMCPLALFVFCENDSLELDYHDSFSFFVF